MAAVHLAAEKGRHTWPIVETAAREARMHSQECACACWHKQHSPQSELVGLAAVGLPGRVVLIRPPLAAVVEPQAPEIWKTI